jgi:hypothetical protein
MFETNGELLQMWCAARKAVPNAAVLAAAMLSLLLPGTVRAAGTEDPVPAQMTHPTPRRTSETTGRPNADEMRKWHESMLKIRTPAKGCYTAKYPDNKWTSVRCKTPPHKLYLPRHGGKGRVEQVGGPSGLDFVTTWNGTTVESEGSFDSVTGVSSECNVQCPTQNGNQVCPANPSCSGQPANSFSLQLNTQPFSNTIACSNSPNPKTCQGWEQFVYGQTSNCSGCTGDAFIQYWLLNFGPAGTACPSPAASASTCNSNGGVVSGQWCSFQFSSSGPVLCVMNANNSAGPPTEAITALNELEITADAPGGGNSSDQITVWEGGIPYRATGENTFPDLASLWKQSEFNVFGNGGGSEAIFNNNVNIHVRNAESSGSTNGPGCLDTSFTGESSNLTLFNKPPAAVEGSIPALLFSETNPAAAGATATCPDATSVGLAPPPPPTAVTAVITLATGNDDARSDTELWGTINGEPPFCLKPSNNASSDGVCNNGGSARDQNGNQSWNNWTSSRQTFPLVTPQPVTSIKTLTIRLLEHNSGFESDDNWDIQGVTVELIDSTGAAQVALKTSNPNEGNNCIARLKGSPNATTVSFGLNGSVSHVYVDGKEAGEITTCSDNGD